LLGLQAEQGDRQVRLVAAVAAVLSGRQTSAQGVACARGIDAQAGVPVGEKCVRKRAWVPPVVVSRICRSGGSRCGR
jgi:hypothetical protein